MTEITCQPKRTIKFYGPLAKALNRRSFKAVGLNSASEVMRCLLSNFPQVGSHMRGRHYRVVMNGRAISQHELDDPVGEQHDVHIIPAISGAGDSGVGAIIAGVALIAIGIIFPFTAPLLVPLGIGLALTGVAALLTPTAPDRPESGDPRDSYNFNGIQQTSREGVPVPVVYGEIFTGSVVLSVGIEEDEGDGGGGGGGVTFTPGTGNPNPDQNPVPDPISEPSPTYIGPVNGPNDGLNSYTVIVGTSKSTPPSYSCGGDYIIFSQAGDLNNPGGVSSNAYALLTTPFNSATFQGRGLRVAYLADDLNTVRRICSAVPQRLGGTCTTTTVPLEMGAIEVLDYKASPTSQIVTGWSTPPMQGVYGNPFTTNTGDIACNVYSDYSTVTPYIDEVFINGISVAISEVVGVERLE